MIPFLNILSSVLCLLAFLTHIFGLPANWFILGIFFLWMWIHPAAQPDTLLLVLLVVAAGVAEVLEFVLQSMASKRYGASSSGNWGAILGAIAGAILFAPLFFGLGAVLGAVAGAYGGCLAVELLWKKREKGVAHQAAVGAMFGKILGLSLKMGVGVLLMVQVFTAIWKG